MKPIKFATPDISRAEQLAVKKVLESGWLTKGPVVSEFEDRIANICVCDRAVAFDSCTAAMEITLRVLGIGPGDEVITTPYTYSATAEVIQNVGAKIVFVDLAKDSFEMDYEQVAKAITDKTKAIMPVDYGGKLCDYKAIYKVIGEKRELFKPNSELQEAFGRIVVVADAAHSFGAELDGMKSGILADFTCFSFHVLKNITTGGEGGAVVWDDIIGVSNDKVEAQFRLYGDHGQTSRDKKSGWEYDIALFGYNHIMTNVDAAVGMAQLDRFDEIKEKRIAITHAYDVLFQNCTVAQPMLQHFGENYTSAMHLYPIKLHTPVALQVYPKGEELWRNTLYKALSEAGVPCNVHYKPLPMMTAYKQAGYDIFDYPNAYERFASMLTIPYHTELTRDQQCYVVETIERTAKNLW